MFGNLKFRTQLFLGNGLVLGLMVIIAGVVYTSVSSLIQNNKWVEHTHEVIGKGDQLVMSLVDMETGERGFMITGDEGYLDPYHGGKETFARAMAEAKQLVNDNPAQVARFAAVEKLAKELDEKVMTVELEARREVVKGDEAYKHFKKLQARTIGKEIFDNLRQVIATLRAKEAADKNMAGVVLLDAILMDMVNQETGQRGFLLTGQEASLEPFIAGKSSLAKHLQQLEDGLRKEGLGDERHAREIRQLAADWASQAAMPEIEARRAMNAVKLTMDDIVAMMGKGAGKKYMDQLRVQIAEITDIEKGLMEQRQLAAAATADRTINISIFGTLVAVLIGFGIVVFLTRNVMNQLGGEPSYIAEVVKKVALGDLTMELKSDGRDVGIFAAMKDMMATLKEKADLATKISDGDLTQEVKLASEVDVLGIALKEMSDNLNKIIGDVNIATDQVSSGSSQVSDSSQSLSQGATEQAASLEEITSSMTQMASQTKTNAENATQANQLAGQTRDAAEKGNSQMQEMVGAMGEINEAGQNISKIIKVIDEIAFQTNLLALNAAVEAARAGRHGKGFAVVAEEVRNLAARSAKAAKETAELIEGSVAKTQNGTQIAEQTSVALTEIVNSVTKVTDLVGEIAAASNEQAQGIAQANQALSQVDQVTQQNTASAEQSAAAAEELSSQAAHMKEMMSHFTIKGGAMKRPAVGYNPASRITTKEKTHWGETSMGKAVKPSEVIALDDGEFGKY
ncbi:MAG: CHASE3 domain-containing protein [Desulfobulbaceae bacterium]|nr:CHASE3 domain-containing protein [Desulfobulbaceae bacterium]HIJ79793.1 chemotaxis protein [Deltaproteobacteria bacterium]